MNLSVTRATAALDDPAAVESLLAVLPAAQYVRAHLAGVRDDARQAAQYDPRAETLHYVASDGTRMVRLSVAGIPQRHAPSAILATHDILKLSAKACGVKLEKLFLAPARAASSTAEAPALHPQVRESLRIVPVARVPTL
jgi:hypothetical protein